MARLPRLVFPGQSLHIMHRGNNRQNIFETDEDMQHFKEDLTVSLSKANCLLHAYVVMTNHFHLLLTPVEKDDLKVFMQSLTNRYVRYFNSTRKRTGTIWEGRFKSCLVDSDAYLFTLFKYIEMNPVRANMVEEPAQYPWSSFHHNAENQTDTLITEHPLYTELAESSEQRAARYRQIFEQTSLDKTTEQITKATQRGEVFGSGEFHSKISQITSRPTQLSSHGGDRKSEDYRNQVG